MDLFGNDTKPEPKLRIRTAIQQWRQLHTIYGKTEGKKCGNCEHLIRKNYSKTYLKCGLATNTNGPATDWRAMWIACGKFEQKKKK
jgi:hypothetical protein